MTNRRRLGAWSAGRIVLMWALLVLTGGCEKKSEEKPTGEAPSAAAAATKGDKPFVVGFVYVGPKGDYGYNQAHAQGAAAVAALPGVKVREEENVAETDAVQKTMESMISLDGASLVFPTSFGYFDPHILKAADKFPN